MLLHYGKTENVFLFNNILIARLQGNIVTLFPPSSIQGTFTAWNVHGYFHYEPNSVLMLVASI